MEKDQKIRERFIYLSPHKFNECIKSQQEMKEQEKCAKENGKVTKLNGEKAVPLYSKSKFLL